ncbi:MAG: hypothetical protein WA751_09230 [Candidatus Dormiibacterota bacterium]
MEPGGGGTGGKPPGGGGTVGGGEGVWTRVVRMGLDPEAPLLGTRAGVGPGAGVLTTRGLASVTGEIRYGTPSGELMVVGAEVPDRGGRPASP